LDFSSKKIGMVGNTGLGLLSGRVSGDELIRDLVEIQAEAPFFVRVHAPTITTRLKGREASKE
jgi:hypothetical protein